MASNTTSSSNEDKYDILIVEDNSITSYHLEALMKYNNYTVRKLKKAEDVLPLVKENAPSAILMDIMLSGKMSGIDAAKALRKENDIPIVFLSALNDDTTLKTIQSITNSTLHAKPFDEEVLLNIVKKLIDQ